MSNTQETNIWKVPGYTATMLAIAAAFGAWSVSYTHLTLPTTF